MKKFLLITAILFLSSMNLFSQAQLLQSFVETNMARGTYIGCSAGDVNGDGADDVIVGVNSYNSGTGRAYIYYGGSSMDNTADVTLDGEVEGDFFGCSVSTAGDINGDGFADVIVGAYRYNSFTGRAYIYYGGSNMDNTADVTLDSEEESNWFGYSVSTAGDVNGDEFADVIVGAYRYNYYTGRAYIYYGGSSMDNITDVTLESEGTDDIFGYSVSTAGDVNGDGADDVIVGAYGYNSHTGRAYIYYGGSNMNNTADITLEGEATDNNFGCSVSTARDVNGDGFADVIVGAYRYNSFTGRAYIYYGGSNMDNTADVTLDGEATKNYFGSSVSTAGDVNRDGFSDVIVGAYSYNSGAGRAYVYYGGSSMDNIADVTFDAEEDDNWFGLLVSTAGDVNGDGADNIIIGAYHYPNNGKVYLYGIELCKINNLDIGGNEDLEHLISEKPQITFDYYSEQGEAQTAYEINVSIDSTFNNSDMWNSGLLVDSATTIEYAGQPLIDGNTYYLRARVETKGFFSKWEHLKFRMNTAPNIPQILTPKNRDVLITPNPKISFLNIIDNEGDSIKYNIKISDDSDFSNIISSVSDLFTIDDTVKWNASGLNDNSSYYVSVNSYDGYESSEYSDTINFYINFTNDLPNIFSLISPNKNSSTTQIKPTFTWNKSTDIDPDDTVKYQLVLDTQDPGVITYDVGTDTSFILTANLTDNSDYYWKVIATDLSGATRESEGSYWKFSVNTSNEAPNPFRTITPTLGSVEITQTPYFYWEANGDDDLQDTVSYTLLIAEDSSLTNLLSYELNINEYQLTDSLKDNALYFWNVIAKDKNGAITYSDTSLFVVNTELEPPLVFDLISPLNNVEELEDTTEFVWSKAEDNDPFDFAVYEIYFSKDSTFSTVDLVAETDTNKTYILEGGLDKGIKYYWFVKAIDTDSLITKSPTYNFVIGTPLSVANEIVPNQFVLEQNYPNPFNPSTMVKYGLPEQSNVKVEIFNTLGQSVGVLINTVKQAGFYETIWNAENLPSGIYLISIRAEGLSSKKNFVQVKKALLLK